MASCTADTRDPASMPTTASTPTMLPTRMGVSRTSAAGGIISQSEALVAILMHWA